jgi:hypothetical protein
MTTMTMVSMLTGRPAFLLVAGNGRPVQTQTRPAARLAPVA